MKALAILLLLGTLALGAVAGLQYLARARRPRLVTLHLAAAGAGIWLLLFLLPQRPAPAGAAAAGLLALAFFGGLMARLLARRSRRGAEWVLTGHVATGIAGVLVFLSWASRL